MIKTIAKAYKTKICPNKEQLEMLVKYAGSSRFVWNWALAEWNKQYKQYIIYDNSIKLYNGAKSVKNIYELCDLLIFYGFTVENMEPNVPKNEFKQWFFGRKITSKNGNDFIIEPTKKPPKNKKLSSNEKELKTIDALEWAFNNDLLTFIKNKVESFEKVENKNKYSNPVKKPNAVQIRNMLPQQKKEGEGAWVFVKETHSYVLNETVRFDLGNAWKNYFDSLKKGNNQFGQPKFKKKDKSSEGFSFKCGPVKITKTHISLPKFPGQLKLARKGYLPELVWKTGLITSNNSRTGKKGRQRKNKDKAQGLITFRNDGKTVHPTIVVTGVSIKKSGNDWFLSLSVHEQIETELRDNNKILGIDVGCRTFSGVPNLAVIGDADKVIQTYPDFNWFDIEKTSNEYDKIDHQIKIISRSLERKRIAAKQNHPDLDKIFRSGRYVKALNRLQRLHTRKANIRENLLHQVTTAIIKAGTEYIFSQKHNVKGMMANPRLAKAIAEVGIYYFHQMLKYKAEWSGAKFEELDQWLPTSQYCLACTKLTKCGSKKEFTCKHCGQL